MRFAALVLGAFLTTMLPAFAQTPGAKTTFEDNYAEVNGQRLHYASVGKGPLVLFLHGYPSFWYQWKDQMAEMGRDHLAVGLDMRGYNLSSRPEGLEPYKMTHLVEDVRQFVEKIDGKGNKFILVGHDWGANVSWAFAMYHPEMLEKLIIVNGAHPFLSERELRENPAQRYASNYFFVFNKYLAPGEQPVDESDTKESATRRAHAGFVDAEVRSGRYTEDDRQAWINAWSQPGSTTAGLNYYRANHRNPPFNDRHPASTIRSLLVGEGSDRRREVDHHQSPHARDLGFEGYGDTLGPPERTRQVGAEPQCQAVSGR